MPVPVSSIFGGSASLGGDTATDVGDDAVIVVGSKTSPSIFEINDISIHFGIPVVAPFANDWEAGGNKYRSFTSRVMVIAAEITKSFSTNIPNNQLYQQLPIEFSKSDILYDALIHRGDIPWNLDYSPITSLGSLRTQPGKVVSVIVFNPTSYTPGGVAQSIHNIFLHVNARLISSDGKMYVGNRHTID